MCKAIVTKTTTTTTITRTITFSQFNKTVPSGTFTIRNNWVCPVPKCNRVVDVVLVFDESGSIDSNEWSQEKAFANTLVAQFNVNIEAATIGVVFFHEHARLVSPLTASAGSVTAAINTGRTGTYTCIGCGITVGI